MLGDRAPNVYGYLSEEERVPERAEVTDRIAASTDRTRAIIDAAFDSPDPSERCRAAVDTLISILASEAGNLALKVLATGGVYLAGGIAVRLASALQQPGFMRAFTRKGRFRDLVARIPVHVITARAALLGAAMRGLESLEARRRTAQGGHR